MLLHTFSWLYSSSTSEATSLYVSSPPVMTCPHEEPSPFLPWFLGSVGWGGVSVLTIRTGVRSTFTAGRGDCKVLPCFTTISQTVLKDYETPHLICSWPRGARFCQRRRLIILNWNLVVDDFNFRVRRVDKVDDHRLFGWLSPHMRPNRYLELFKSDRGRG